MLDQVLIRRVEDKILEVLELAQIKFGRTFEVPKLSFDLKSNRVAGRAFYSTNEIEINPLFLSRFPDEVLNRTVGHECGHLITHKVYPNAKQYHGPQFKFVMRSLGLPDSRCHNMVLEEKRPHKYICGCPGKFWNVSNIVHHRMQRQERRWCRKCKKFLYYVES